MGLLFLRVFGIDGAKVGKNAVKRKTMTFSSIATAVQSLT